MKARSTWMCWAAGAAGTPLAWYAMYRACESWTRFGEFMARASDAAAAALGAAAILVLLASVLLGEWEICGEGAGHKAARGEGDGAEPFLTTKNANDTKGNER